MQQSALDPRGQFSCLTVALRAVAEPAALAAAQPALLLGLLRLLGALAADPATGEPILQVPPPAAGVHSCKSCKSPRTLPQAVQLGSAADSKLCQ